MAKLNASFVFTGPIDNLSAYTMRGVDGVILRKKGGASKSKIKRSPKFKNTRKLNAEFSGLATAGKWIRSVLHSQKPVADYNISGPLNALLKPVQRLDTKGLFGRRNVLLSKSPSILDGFSLNRKTPLDSIIRSPLLYSVSRDKLSARVVIPALVPGINFNTNEKSPMYSLVASLGIVPDLFYGKMNYTPASRKYKQFDEVSEMSAWYPVLQGSPALTLDLQQTHTPPDQSFSLVLSIGIRFGTMRDAATVQQVKYAGAAKILVAV